VLAAWAAAACRTAAPPSPGDTVLDARRAAPRQVLLRATVRGDGRAAGLRLTLRVWRPERFDLSASDLLGRGVWRLATDGEHGLWTDLRQERSCRFAAAAPQARFGGVVLPLASRDLPAVLLGELPAPLAQLAAARRGDGTERIELADEENRRWRLRLDGRGEVKAWQVEEGGDVRLAWERAGERLRLRSFEPALELEWRELAREPLVAPPVELGADAWAAPECANGDLP
jgi:hypothetical protein